MRREHAVACPLREDGGQHGRFLHEAASAEALQILAARLVPAADEVKVLPRVLGFMGLVHLRRSFHLSLELGQILALGCTHLLNRTSGVLQMDWNC